MSYRLLDEDFLCEPELLRERPEGEELLLEEDFFFGTRAPSLRASERPMATACLRLVTFLPLRPLFNVPCFFSCIARATFLPAFGLYFLPPEDLRAGDFLVAMNILPSPEWEAKEDGEVARMGSRQATVQAEARERELIGGRSGGDYVFDVHPLGGIVAGVAGDAEVIAFAAVAGFT